jgi:hypothetical protein
MELEVWQATGPVKYEFMSLAGETLDALCDVARIEMPPIYLEDRPKLNLVG